jgi:hypothetical protein
MRKSNLRNIFVSTAISLALCGAAAAQSKPDRFYLPQPDQPFEGTVDTRIGTLEFSNQYPSKESMQTILDNMDFHGATQAYLWGIPIASFSNLQYFLSLQTAGAAPVEARRKDPQANGFTPRMFPLD